jgi:succinate dehydrogenase / fumarate reductase flavoprotein subunit
MELADVDITKEPMEVGPTCHYMMGGVRVDPETQESTVPGLLAAGEVAGGLHGANRLGGNSLSDLLVFGKRAGEFAASVRPIARHRRIDGARWSVWRRNAAAVADREAEIHRCFATVAVVMQNLVGIVRTEEDLKVALGKIAELRARAANVKCGGNIQYNPGWHLALDLANMLDISEAVTRAALERTESRGAHTREDHPHMEKEWGTVNVIVRQSAAGIGVARAPLAPLPDDLKKLVEGD